MVHELGGHDPGLIAINMEYGTVIIGENEVIVVGVKCHTLFSSGFELLYLYLK